MGVGLLGEVGDPLGSAGRVVLGVRLSSAIDLGAGSQPV